MGQTYNRQEGGRKTLHQYGFCRYKTGYFGRFYFPVGEKNDNSAGTKAVKG